jgi:hypothetical protein
LFSDPEQNPQDGCPERQRVTPEAALRLQFEGHSEKGRWVNMLRAAVWRVLGVLNSEVAISECDRESVGPNEKTPVGCRKRKVS